ncbi:magnetosome protein Mad11 [Candidatus Magnetobacterium bavaricum]|uniref:Magnetosome protein Mad11 n=1 Tax=Candidatus Magnetobacterium bavaricum TaxID=29290 RepID=A0A0F3GMB8_9BACT|nr:magnetosome protein Mad11 [Candidatus Magnetobacterium bavaricum]
MTPKDIMSSGIDVLNETWLYSVASVEYSGLLSYSYLKRGADLAAPSWDYVAQGSVRYVAEPVVQAGQYVGKLFKKLMPFGKFENRYTTVINILAERDRKLEAVQERVRKIEERLTNIERHGVVVADDITVIKKEVDEYKKALLRGVLQDNIMLREEA